jgi:LysM repeat protein
MGPRVGATALAAAVLLAGLPMPGWATDAGWCHRVRRGDTLYGIARRHGATVRQLMALNGLRRPVLLAGTTLKLPAFRRLRRGTLPISAPSLSADRGNLRRENRAADRDDLSRLRDRAMVRRFVRAGLLVPVARATTTYRVESVPADLRVTRPWSKRFIEQLAAGFHRLFGDRLKVTGLVRTTGAQRALRQWNGNAAPAVGERRSTHLTGAAVDISTRPMSARQAAWVRRVLARLQARGVVHAIEEFSQPHFHVLVRKRYGAYARTVGPPELLGGC